MKRILFLGILFCSVMAIAQGTTQKEYNYASKGYSDDLAMGKDVIAGYRVENAGSSKITVVNEFFGNTRKGVIRSSKILKLVRIEGQKVAALILMQRRDDTNNITYFAIPNSSADANIWQQARDLYSEDFWKNKCQTAAAPMSYGFNVIQLLSEALSN